MDPWYTEYFYNELKPWVHYVPATLDNIVNVTTYVLNNEDEMQSIIRSANAWCQDKITREGMARDMMKQIQKYELAIDDYMDEHAYSQAMLMGTLEDLNLDLMACKSPDKVLLNKQLPRKSDEFYTREAKSQQINHPFLT